MFLSTLHIRSLFAQGVCYEGSLERPASGPEKTTCDALYATEHSGDTVPETAVFSWNYVRCPPENECENGHHSCDNKSEQCVDLPSGYKCECGVGYKSDNADCVPVSSSVSFFIYLHLVYVSEKWSKTPYIECPCNIAYSTRHDSVERRQIKHNKRL